MSRPIVQRVGLVLVSTLASLCLAELVLRAMNVRPDRFIEPVHLETGDKRHGVDLYPDDPRGYFGVDLHDETARAALRAVGLTEVDARYERTPFAVPGIYSAELCRGGDIPPPSDTRRVLFIGDSFTEGQGVREEDTFVARLRALRPGEELINCGRRGYDFPRLREWLELRLSLEPDVVVYAMVLNDPHQSPAFHERQAYLDDWILDRRRMIESGDGAPPWWTPLLFAVLDDRIEGARVGAETERWYQEMVGAPNAEGWARTLDDLSAMREATEARGARFVVVLWPLMASLEGDYPFAAAHRTIVDDVGARGIEIHDTLDAFLGQRTAELWVHPADHHPNERAHALFAGDIARWLER